MKTNTRVSLGIMVILMACTAMTVVAGPTFARSRDDLAGLGSDGSIWYTVDKANWSRIPGSLASLLVGDFDGNGMDDLAGLGLDGSIWYITDRWHQVPGSLASLLVGDFDGNGISDLAGLGSDGSIWYTVDKAHWSTLCSPDGPDRVGRTGENTVARHGLM